MTDRPILFSAPMIQALLEGRKTQTRRVLKPQPCSVGVDGRWYRMPGGGVSLNFFGLPYNIGDRLWVKENHGFHGTQWCSQTPDVQTLRVSYAADKSVVETTLPLEESRRQFPKQNVPSFDHVEDEIDRYYERHHWLHDWWQRQKRRSCIHMPRYWSRITLTVSDVRVQRVQDISETDAVAEGLSPYGGGDVDALGQWHRLYDTMVGDPGGDFAIPVFRDLWNSINEKRGFGWDANPWVIALTFEVHKHNIDRMPA